MIVIGLDPGLGVKSPTGLTVFDPESRAIRALKEIWPPKRVPIQEKLFYARQSFERFLVETRIEKDEELLLASEYFVMRGKGGESLQRLIGAYFSALLKDTEVIEVQNVKVKMALGGKGDASKEEVAEGVYSWFKVKNIESANIIRGLITAKKWDLLDSLAIGITGYLEREAQ